MKPRPRGSRFPHYFSWRTGKRTRTTLGKKETYSLDPHGAEPAQGTFIDESALGTPLRWSTDDVSNKLYHPLNTCVYFLFVLLFCLLVFFFCFLFVSCKSGLARVEAKKVFVHPRTLLFSMAVYSSFSPTEILPSNRHRLLLHNTQFSLVQWWRKRVFYASVWPSLCWIFNPGPFGFESDTQPSSCHAILIYLICIYLML